MTDINVEKIREEPEGGITATFKCGSVDHPERVVVEVKAPSFLDAAMGLKFVGREDYLEGFLAGVSDPDGWEEIPDTNDVTKTHIVDETESHVETDLDDDPRR